MKGLAGLDLLTGSSQACAEHHDQIRDQTPCQQRNSLRDRNIMEFQNLRVVGTEAPPWLQVLLRALDSLGIASTILSMPVEKHVESQPHNERS